MSAKKNKGPKIALVYDRVNTPYGGAEHVLRALNEIFPEAPLFTSVYSKKATWANSFSVVPSFLQKVPFFRNRHQLLASLMPVAFESLDLSKFDIVISVTSAEAKGVVTSPDQLHICYLLTPTRYLYSHKDEYLNSNLFLKIFPINIIARALLKYLEWWDKSAIFRPDIIIPISKLVKNRVKKYYFLESSEVIYPPINEKVREVVKLETKVPFYLSISRLVDYKRVDLNIRAALELNKILVVVGTGENQENLMTIAPEKTISLNENESLIDVLERAKSNDKNIIFTGKISEEFVNQAFSNCEGVLMPGEEDFGITGLEAGFFGKPVIVFYKSGVAELLTNEVDSVFIKEETVNEVVNAIKKLDSLKFNDKLIKSRTKNYYKNSFKQKFEKVITDNWKS